MTVLGVDISKWNGNWDAVKAKQAGATFAFIKASQATFTDPKFLVNWKKAKDAGLLRGAYHYLDYTKPGIDQANYFADLLKDDPGELPPIIDYELRRTDNTPSAALGFLRENLDQLIKRTELFQDSLTKRPMLYMGPYMWIEYGEQTRSDYWIQFPLWIAHWTTSSAPMIPLPWTMWNFWQFSSKGPGEAFGGEGLVMDMDRFNGTLNELMEFAGVRIPVINLTEKFEALDANVKVLDGIVTTVNNRINEVTGSGVTTRIDTLEGQVTSFGGTLNTLTTDLNKRLTLVEQKITSLGTAPVVTPPVVTPPVVIPPVNIDVPVTPPVVQEPSSSSSYATCSTSSLNVRSGPAATNSIIGGLRYGQRVKVIKHQSGWAQLESPSGWCSEAYLSYEQSAAPQPVVTPPPAASSPANYGICNTSGLNVRSGAGVTFPIVGGLTYGQRTKILTAKNGWVQIETPSGWCNASYLSFA
jgi:lysozyme